MRRFLPAILFCACAFGLAAAQVREPAPDTSGLATAASIATMQALIPTPGASVPPPETVGGALGTTTTQYALANHTHPRITRATTVTTIAGGTFSGTWSAALGLPPNIVLTPISSGSASTVCKLTLSTLSHFLR